MRMITRRSACFILATSALLVYARPVSGVLVISATDAGFVTMMGGSAKGDGTLVASAKYNYSVGFEEHYATGALGAPLAPMFRKNYFVFDLTSVTTPISSAAMKVYAGPAIAPAFPAGTHGYESLDPTETYVIGDTPTQAAALGLSMSLAGGALPAEFDSPADPLVLDAKLLFTMLSVGPPLAMKIVSAADDGTFLTLSFTPAGVGFLNSNLGSKVILGGILPTAMPPAFPQEIFGFTGPDIAGGDPLTPTLELTSVPEAGCVLFVAVGLLLMGVIGRRRGERSVK